MSGERDDEGLRVVNAIDERRKGAETKALDVSLNELADMYEGGELAIQPEYQRMFRWSDSKQSQFIESLLLEMPIPPVFVIESQEGEWELIDGLQRISSYLHFRGILESPGARGDDSSQIKAGEFLTLDGCDIVPELNGLQFETLPTALRIRLKRSFLRVEVVRKETSTHFRYYMFKRLNTGGEALSDQEVRNCTIRLLGNEFNDLVITLARSSDFQKCIEPLSDERRRQMGDVELVLRFFAFKNNFREFRHDVADFLSDYMERVSDASHKKRLGFDYKHEQEEFELVFRILARTLGTGTCLRSIGNGYGGQFLMHHFEAMSLGVARAIKAKAPGEPLDYARIEGVLGRIKADDDFKRLTTGGGKNSPGPYNEKIDFVATRLEEVL